MRDMILLNRVLAGSLLCVLLLPAAYCRAGEKEESAIRYFTAEPAERYYMYSFLYEKLKGEEALPEEEDRVRRVLDKLIRSAVSTNEISANRESWQSDSEPWVLVTPNEKFNAYALPGGIFVVNRGVLMYSVYAASDTASTFVTVKPFRLTEPSEVSRRVKLSPLTYTA